MPSWWVLSVNQEVTVTPSPSLSGHCSPDGYIAAGSATDMENVPHYGAAGASLVPLSPAYTHLPSHIQLRKMGVTMNLSPFPQSKQSIKQVQRNHQQNYYSAGEACPTLTPPV